MNRRDSRPNQAAPAGSDPGTVPTYRVAVQAVKRPFPKLLEFAGLLAAAVASQLVLVQVLLAAGLETKNPLHLALMAVAASLVWVGAAALPLRVTGRPVLSNLGLGRVRVRRPRAFLLLSFLAGLACVLPSTYLFDLVKHWSPPHSPDILQLVGKSHPGPLAIALTVLATALAAPFGEEVFFRGLSLGGLARNYGPVGASVAVSIMFAAIHFDVAKMPPIFLLSLLLCLLALRSGSIWPAVAAHAAYNGLQVAGWLATSVGHAEPPKAERPPLALVVVSLGFLAVIVWAVLRLSHHVPSGQTQERSEPV